VTLNLAEKSVAKSRPSVLYGANLLIFVNNLTYGPVTRVGPMGAGPRQK